MRDPNATVARIAIFAAASAPFTSSVGSGSAKPSRCASASASSYSSPCSICERMKFVVPLTIPSTRCTLVATSDSRSTLITGIAAHTDASKRSWTPLSDAVAKSSAPRRATSCLFALTTGLPARRRSRTYSPAGSRPPISSATRPISGSSRIDAKSVVRTPLSGTCSRSRAGSRTSALTIRSRCPVARSMSSALSASSRATAPPTLP